MRFVGAFLLCVVLAACATGQRKASSAPPTLPDFYLIVFQGRATAILPKAAAIINNVAANANEHPDKLVQVTGPFTKTAPHYTPKLAVERMREVEHALEAVGVDKERIVRAFARAASLKADGTGSQQIEIRLVNKPDKTHTADSATPSQIAGSTPY